jgi:hypothetical protein
MNLFQIRKELADFSVSSILSHKPLFEKPCSGVRVNGV